MSEHVPLTFLTGHANCRLDVALRDGLGMSRAAALRLLEAGRVRINDRVVGNGHKGLVLAADDVVTVELYAHHAEVPRPDPTMRLAVLARGEGWLAVDKPAGMAVRPHGIDEVGTVINAVAAMHPEVVGVGEGGLRSGVVHRLDNETSGVLVVATRQDAWAYWRTGFAEHRTDKQYAAVVAGRFEQAGRIERWLSVAQHRPARVRVWPREEAPRDARRCTIVVEPVRVGNDQTLLKVELETGFLHQIRVMLADLGHPVLGDPVYGDSASSSSASPRLMLHAQRLMLDDIAIEAPLPEAFDVHA